MSIRGEWATGRLGAIAGLLLLGSGQAAFGQSLKDAYRGAFLVGTAVNEDIVAGRDSAAQKRTGRRAGGFRGVGEVEGVDIPLS